VKLTDLPVIAKAPTVTAAQMVEVDRIASEEMKVGVELLMENASRQIAAAARALLGGTVAGKHVMGLIGPGNNGADTLGALRHLTNWGATVLAVVAVPHDRIRETTRAQLTRLVVSTDRHVSVFQDATKSTVRSTEGDLVLDGLLGYSSRGAPRGMVADLIGIANTSSVPILAVDIPSGLDPDSGAAPGVVIRPAATVTLALPKAGLIAPQANVGELVLADIGIPPAAFAKLGVETRGIFDEGDLVRIRR
jgi:NAD(P)H-hydrate epimerase